VGAVAPADSLQIHQAQERFVDEGGRLQRVVRALARHISRGQAVQFMIDERREALQRFGVAGIPGEEQPRDLAPVWLFFHVSPFGEYVSIRET
jgi:hypothetical protein